MESNNNPRETISSESENYDQKGDFRGRKIMPDGTIAFLSEKEYAEEMKTRNEEKNNQ